MNNAWSGNDLLGLICTAYGIGGSGVVATLLGCWRLSQASRQRTAVQQTELRRRAFGLLLPGVPGVMIGGAAFYMLYVKISTATILTLGVMLIAALAVGVIIAWRHLRADKQHADTISLEIQASDLYDES